MTIDIETRTPRTTVKKYTTIDALAQTLRVTPRHVSNLIRRGMAGVIHVGKSVRIDEAKALAWLEETGGQPSRPETG